MTTMKKHILHGSVRTIVGRKVKKLRAEGYIPANVFGKKTASVSLSVKTDAFQTVFAETGETGLVELAIEKEQTPRPVLVHHVQVDPVSGAVLHVEFFQVDLKEKVHAQVPLEFTGTPPAVEQNLGVLLTVLTEVEAEALPAELPDHIAVDVSGLVEVNQELKVSDLVVPKGVTLLTDAGLTVLKIGALTKPEEVAPVAPAPEEGAQGTPAEEGEGELQETAEKPEESKEGQKNDASASKNDKKEEKK